MSNNPNNKQYHNDLSEAEKWQNYAGRGGNQLKSSRCLKVRMYPKI